MPLFHYSLSNISQRGEHDVENSFQYPSAHGFIFHDSRGFEAGTTGELEDVTDFIKKRAEKKELKDRLHAIWCARTCDIFRLSDLSWSGIAFRLAMIDR